MNIKPLLLFITSIFFGILNPCYTQGINFAPTSVSNLHKARKQLKKPIMLYLYEDDCIECKKMEKFTFNDPGLSSMVNQHLLSGKIDINTAEGSAIRKKLKINLAPALIFYDHKGKPLLQQETSMSSSDILKLLAVLYDIPVDLSKSKIATERFEIYSDTELELPAQISPSSIVVATIKSKREPIIRKPRKTEIIKVPPKNIVGHVVEVKGEAKILTNSRNENRSSSVSKSVLVNDVTEYNSIVNKANSESFNVVKSKLARSKSSSLKKNRIVQLGAYLKYDDVLKSMYRMKRKIDLQLTIIEENTLGKVMYKLVSSEHMTVSQAQSLHQFLKNQGIDSFVRLPI